MRTLAGLAACLVLTVQPGFAESLACRLDHASYTDANGLIRLDFRAGTAWELAGMISSVFEGETADGEVIWGFVHGTMGNSRDTVKLYADRPFTSCARPAVDGPAISEEDCLFWQGPAYALTDSKLEAMPFGDAPAPESLVLVGLGQGLHRFTLWDQLFLHECRPPTPQYGE